jgi:hypothetical protein
MVFARVRFPWQAQCGNTAGEMRMDEMASEPVNLDNDPTLEVVTLGKLLSEMGIAWHMRNTLESWVDDPEIPTPKPKIKVNGEWHWEPTDSTKEKFKELIAIDAWLEAEQRQRALESVGIRADVLTELLIGRIRRIEALNRRCGKHNRGNSLQDGRRRCIEMDANREFLGEVLNHLKIDLPVSKSHELNDLIRKAKDHVNVQ